MKKLSKKKFQELIIKNCPLVKFKTKHYAALPSGSIVKIYKISDDGVTVLLYAPYDKSGQGCFIVAIPVKGKDYYIDTNSKYGSWVNFET